MVPGLSELLKSLLLLVLLIVPGASGLSAAEIVRGNWQKNFLAELKQIHENGSSQRKLGLADYASGLKGHNPKQLLQIVEERVALRPYAGSMVDPTAALMGGNANSLDRARLLSALLTRANYDNRIVYHPFEPGEASIDYPPRTPAPLQPLDPQLYRTVQGEVQTLAPGLWQRLCEEAQDCADWQTSLQTDHAEQHVYWVQVQQQGDWHNLVPRESRLSPSALSQARVLDEQALAGVRWTITLQVTNTYAGGMSQPVLEVSLPAAELHGRPISYDNLPDSNFSGFQPSLSVGDSPIYEGTFFKLNHQGQGLVYQQLHIIIKGPAEARKYSRTLAVPFAQAKGLEMATRGAITLSTGPFWDDLTEELLERDLHRLANLLYAAPDRRDPAPLNMTSFRALSLLKLSWQLSGQVGLASPEVLAYQARPAIVFIRTYPEMAGGQAELFRSFDIVEPGHGFVSDAGTPQVAMKAAMEQSIVDGLLEDWLASGDGEDHSSHKLGMGLLLAGSPLVSSRPDDPSWLDEYNGTLAAYRLGNTPAGIVGWRLDPGPQVVPLLAGGLGGAKSNIAKESAKSGISAFVYSLYRYATSKCGASDIGGSIILALAGAPMTSPLLSGIVGHMCRVAEAYNKAADALNCLEFMGNDCSSAQKAKELEKMLKGLGKDLAIDLALAQALDIAVGGAIAGIAPSGKALGETYDAVMEAKLPKKSVSDSASTTHQPPKVAKKGTDTPTTGKAKPDEPSTTAKKGDEPSTGSKADEPATPKKADEPVTGSKADEPGTTAKADEPATHAKKTKKSEPTIKEPEHFDPNAPEPPLRGNKYKDSEIEMGERYKQKDKEEGIKIYNETELEGFRVIADQDGKLIYAKSGKPVNTNQEGIYIMDKHGNVFVHENPQSGPIKHSSLAGGKKPAGGGRIYAEDGKVLLIDEGTGHYGGNQPAGRVYVVNEELKNQGVDMRGATLEPYY